MQPLTFADLQELFISAALTDRRLPNNTRPADLRGKSLPYVHDFADMATWPDLEDRRQDFFDPDKLRLTVEQCSEWERANELVRLVDDIGQRRALLHWAKAKAGGKPFKFWCRKEGIHPETGTRRKNRALTLILRKTSGVRMQMPPETREDDSGRVSRSWMDDDTENVRLAVLADWRGNCEARNAERRMLSG